ncbi:hypothetical protein B0I37DRAFT_356367 [Chaetomium sp. MPI-CAGE-AT-0009]|nr:hypothetical protein B0I37DRAFT_356367 [Chaetomium sp. MPI-CAGE-AT-0009]
MADSYQKPTVESDDEPSPDISTDDVSRKASEAYGNEPILQPQSPVGVPSHAHRKPTDPRRSSAFSGTPPLPRNLDEKNIFVKDGIGRKLSFPFELARTWRGVEELIQQACVRISSIGDEVKEGRYDLVAPDGSVILPIVWDLSVQPGWFVTMHMWKDEEAKRKNEEILKQKAVMWDDAQAKIPKMEEDTGRKKEKAPIRFKDAVGRKFSFPFHLVQTWQGMEELIKQAFLHVDVLGPHVQEGHYDLIGPDGEIILPQVWEKVIQPDWVVTMHMWPMDKAPLRPNQPRPGHRPGFAFSRPASSRPPGATMPIPPPPPPPARSKKGGGPSHVLGWMTGGRASRATVNIGDTSPTINSRSRSPSVEIGAGTDYHPSAPSRKAKEPASQYGAGQALMPFRPPQRTEADFANNVGDPFVFPLRHHISEVGGPPGTARRVEKNPGMVIAQKMTQKMIQKPGPLAILGLLSRAQERTLNRRPHVTRKFMSFREFEEMARFDLPLDEKARALTTCLINSIKSEKLDEDWHIKPGTVLRCDGDVEEDHESALFVSVPSLHSIPYDNATAQKGAMGICPERKLRDAFGSLGTHYEQGKNRFAVDGRHELDLWVRQTWILVTSCCIFTYGSFSLDTLQGQTITVLDEILPDTDSSGGIQIVDDDRRLFYIPSANRKSYYELKVAASDQLIRAGKNARDCVVQLHLPDGEELGPKTWAKLVRSDELPTLKVSLEDLTPPPPSGAGSSHHSTRSRTASSTRSGRSRSTSNSLDLDDEHKPDISGNENESDSASKLLNRLNDLTTGNERHLNDKVLPFFGWMSGDSTAGVRAIEKGFREGIIRIDLKLSRPDTNTPHSMNLMDDLHKSFSGSDVYQEAPLLTFTEFEHARASWTKGKKTWANSLLPPLHHDQVLAMAAAYFDVATLILESFISPGYDAVPVKKYFGALSEIMKDPTHGWRSDNMDQDASDPDVPAPSEQGQRSKWVISQKRTRDGDIRYRGRSGDEDDCPECIKGTVYATLEAAASHLRRAHLVGSMTDERLRYYLLPLSEAVVEMKEWQQARMLEFGADTMARILRKLVAIQDGVVHDDELREKRGLPHELLEAFAIIVAFVCALSHIMHNISWFYTDDIPQNSRDIEDLVPHRVQGQRDMLLRLGTEAENLIRKAERALTSPTLALLNGADGPESFQVSVGPHYVAAQIACNLLKLPAKSQKHAVDLYEANLKTLKSRLLRHPSKRYILSITAVADELNMLSDFFTWQGEAISSFDAILHPETYRSSSSSSPSSDRSKLYPMEHRLLQRSAGTRLARDSQGTQQMLEACGRMVAEVRELTAIMADDKGRALFIFTAVTVVFLPLSFVASYVSMLVGGTGAGFAWPAVHALFWEVAGPLTAGGCGWACTGVGAAPGEGAAWGRGEGCRGVEKARRVEGWESWWE